MTTENQVQDQAPGLDDNKIIADAAPSWPRSAKNKALPSLTISVQSIKQPTCTSSMAQRPVKNWKPRR